MSDSICIYCPICGTQFLDIPAKEGGVILEHVKCLYCMNMYLILIAEGRLIITAELVP